MSDSELPKEPVTDNHVAWLSVNTLGILLTFAATAATAGLSWETNNAVHRSDHAAAFADAFTKHLDKLTLHFSSNKRVDEQQADLVLTVLDDLAQTSDDQIAMLSAAARMLNATECPSNGESTARFLSGVIARLKQDDAHRWFFQRSRALEFVRSRAFLDLASSDVASTYYSDYVGYVPKICSAAASAAAGPSPAVAPSSAVAPNVVAARSVAVAPNVAIAANVAVPAAKRSRPDPRPQLINPPQASDRENHATWWGEQTAWNDSKNALFRELRSEPYYGWIHVATWEAPDRCVDDDGKTKDRDVRCTSIRVQYTSLETFAFQEPAKDAQDPILAHPLWLGRARFLRDAPPVTYEHAGDSAMNLRGSLGHVIGVVDYGECVKPLETRFVHVSLRNGERKFVHEWALVTDAGITARENDVACGRSQRPPAGKT